jgi:predicted CoA-binding protein
VDEALKALLAAKTIAVVGLDTRTQRDAYRVAKYLQEQGYRIIPVPVQQAAEVVLGERAFPSLREVPVHVDLVDVFVRSEHTGRIIDDAIAAGAGAIWLQEGIRNEAGLERARAAGLAVAQDRCTMVEHRDVSRP